MAQQRAHTLFSTAALPYPRGMSRQFSRPERPAARPLAARLRGAGLVALALALAPLAAPALANDSEAEIGMGGIVVLKQSRHIVMESEDLLLSEALVRVSYRFRNPTARDIETTVAFPLPRQPRGMMARHYDEDRAQDWSGFGFATRIDGAPVRMRMIERAMIGDRDVTDRVNALGLPLFWPAELSRIEALDDERRAALLAEGLLTNRDPAWPDTLVPAWDLATFFVRDQVFPANSTVTVEHEYVPMTGGSVGGALYPSVRKESPEILADYRRRYCVDQSFLAGVDRRLAAIKPGTSSHMSETWLGYVLSSGANWNGPIRDFRLVVDKGEPDNLVSFCMDGVTKISPTRFEVRKRDFTPKGDLAVLIAKYHRMEE